MKLDIKQRQWTASHADAIARIEALEKALRAIEDICIDRDHEAACMATVAIARAALESDKP